MLAWASEAHVAVIPRGGGSGVCGGAGMPGGASRGRGGLGRARPVPAEPDHRRRPGLAGGDGRGGRARRPARGRPGRSRADRRPLPAVDRRLHRRRLDRGVLRGPGLRRIRGHRGRAARPGRGPAAGRHPPVPAGAAFGRRTRPAAAPGGFGGDACGGDRGDPGLPGPPGRLGLAGVRLRILPGAGQGAARRRARGDGRGRHPRLRRGRRPAQLRGARSHQRLRGAARLPGRARPGSRADAGGQETGGGQRPAAGRVVRPAGRLLRGALVAAPQRRGGHLRQHHGPRTCLRPGGDRGHLRGRRALVRRAAAL